MVRAEKVIRADGPLLLFGGPYSNLEATQALLNRASALGIPPSRSVCTGDVVAYGADPAATVALIRSSGCHVVMGNCEESLAAGGADCGCGFPAGSQCEQLSVAWFTHAAAELDAGARTWMAGLPRRIDIAIGDVRFAAIHGGAERINRFVFASTASPVKLGELDATEMDGIIAGHCGLPFTQKIGQRLWHNAGAIGLPANDGTPRIWYSVLRIKHGNIIIEHCALEYDYRTAAAKIRRTGLPEQYAAALETGLWPSCDVLPLKEIQHRGMAIEEGSIAWRPQPEEKRRGKRHTQQEELWPAARSNGTPSLDALKFKDPFFTAKGEPRASVALRRLKTLWFNTGTLCNITCRSCYIESSPKNDRLVYLKRSEVAAYLDEIERDGWDTEEIGFTGGEPFLNPEFIPILEDCLARGFRVLVLTNAMRPMQRMKAKLLDLNARLGEKLTVRVSLDHFTPERHEDERGHGTFRPTLEGLIWLARSGFKVAVAGRTMWHDEDNAERAGYRRLFEEHKIPVDANDRAALVIFPEMDVRADVPEITQSCWQILGKSPDAVMCASSRMVVKRKGSQRPAVLACTLVPYDEQFELGHSLKDASRPVRLNHPNCARFCVLGGGSCSAS
jgi:pyruvate-formate lyase-activating enzyme/predicted phosphodiesterase